MRRAIYLLGDIGRDDEYVHWSCAWDWIDRDGVIFREGQLVNEERIKTEIPADLPYISLTFR